MVLIDNYLNKKLIQVINKSINIIYKCTYVYIIIKEKFQVNSQSTER